MYIYIYKYIVNIYIYIYIYTYTYNGGEHVKKNHQATNKPQSSIHETLTLGQEPAPKFFEGLDYLSISQYP